MLKVYVAAISKSHHVELNDKHLTLSFGDAIATDKLSFSELMRFFPCQGYVKDVVYWEQANVTVAILNVENILCAQKYCESVGFSYDLEFIPHITLGKGNVADESKGLVGNSFELVDCYIRMKDFS